MESDDVVKDVNEAFQALLAHNFEAARKALARAQVGHYGQRPWFPGAPERDAIGNQLVYRDPDGHGRYVVAATQPDGSHVRVYFGVRAGPIQDFEARGPTGAGAVLAAVCYGREGKLQKIRQTSSFSDGASICIRFQHGGPLLD